MFIRHPKETQLARWLEGENLKDVEAHVESCVKCMHKCESINSDVEDDLGSVLALALAPSDGFEDRIHTTLKKRAESKSTLGLISDFLSVGIETSKILVTEEANDESD